MEDSFSSIAENLFVTYLVDRRRKRGEEVKHSRRPSKGHGNGCDHISRTDQYKQNERSRVPWNMCKLRGKKGCHSLVQQKNGLQIYKRIAIA